MAVMMSDVQQAKTAEKIAERRSEGTPDTFTASNGAVLHLKKVSYNLSVEASKSVPEPQPPTTFIKDLEREETNYDDPGFKKALIDRQMIIGDLTNMLYLTVGIKSVDISRATDIPACDDVEWSEEIELATEGRVVIPVDGRKRQTLWLKYVILADINDFRAAITAIARYSSSAVAVRDVESVEKSFRSEEVRDTSDGTGDSE